jgi:hypothetical protein
VTVEKKGFTTFFNKNIPQFVLHTPVTWANSALEYVFIGIHSSVDNKLDKVKSICLMLDGWSDWHNRRLFMDVQASFIDD